jgi:DNA-binding MarR family transcriptional regulator
MKLCRRYESIIQYIAGIKSAMEGSLNLTELLILLHLAVDHPTPVAYRELAKELDTTVTTIARTIKRLGAHKTFIKGEWVDCGMGLVDAGPNPYNTREFVATLSPKGLALMEKLKKRIQ